MENEASFSPFVYFLLFFFYSFFRFSPYYSLNGNYCTPSSSLFFVLFFLLFFTNQQNIFPWNIMLSQFATVAITKWTTTHQHVSSRSFVCLCSFLSFFCVSRDFKLLHFGKPWGALAYTQKHIHSFLMNKKEEDVEETCGESHSLWFTDEDADTSRTRRYHCKTFACNIAYY